MYPSKLFNVIYPQDSARAAYFVRRENIWLDEYGNEYLDLKDFGFTALQRETILRYIHNNPEAEYTCVPNNNGELIEIFWINNLNAYIF